LVWFLVLLDCFLSTLDRLGCARGEKDPTPV